MDVTIVIVSYNVSSFLERCLSSIERGTSCEHEIIVVDNNSQDDSVRIVRTHHPAIKLLVNQSNKGFAKANNQAFRLAQGRYVLMLNPDTVVLNSAVDKLVRFMDERPNAGACGPKNLGPDLSLQYNCHHFPSLSIVFWEYLQLRRFFPKSRLFGREHMTYWDYDDVREVDWITGCSLVIRKAALEEVGYLDESYFMYSEECDLCLQLKRRGLKTVFCPGASIIHYAGLSALGQDREKVANRSITSYLFRARYHFFRKNRGIVYLGLVKGLDLVYHSIVLLKNIFRSGGEVRRSKMDEARAVLSECLSSEVRASRP